MERLNILKAKITLMLSADSQLLDDKADPQQIIAELRRELAACEVERDEAIARQAATTQVLQLINASPGDLAPVFGAMLEHALRLCEGSFGFVTVYNGARFDRAVQRGVPDALAEYFKTGIDQPRPGDAHWRLLEGEDLIHNLDQMDEEAYQQGNPLRRAVVDLGGARSALVVALRKDRALLGALTSYRKEVRPFSDKQTALLQNFSTQAAIAMENARLLGELRGRTEEVARWNCELEVRVAAQVAELERIGKLRRFLAPQLAEMIVARGDESILESHRREIVVVFCDIRGFAAFAERAEPEEVMALLRHYHAALGPIVMRFEGTLDHYGGDGIMVFFNDPLPMPEPAKRAIEMAVAMREAAADVAKSGDVTAMTSASASAFRGAMPPGPDRFCRAHGLYGDWNGHESRRATLQRGQRRADPGERARRHRGRGHGIL